MTIEFAGKEIREERKENCQYQAFFTLLVCVEMLQMEGKGGC